MPAGTSLTSRLFGGRVGLSDDAARGRKEALGIAAAVWLAPIITWVQGATGSLGATPASFSLGDAVVNVLIFAGLARGRPWARKLTMVILAATAVARPIVPVVIDAGAQSIAAGLLSGGIYGAMAVILWRSPYLRAYFESHDGLVRFPKRERRVREETR